MSLKKYTRKPETVHAIEWTGENLDELKAGFPGYTFSVNGGELKMNGFNSEVRAGKNDYLVQSAEAIVYRVSKWFFEDKYW